MGKRGGLEYICGTLPTRYTYSGQYSYASDFGLVFYGSRFYDPLLARWAPPDSIISQNQGTLVWDRYAYINNSPVRFVDPTRYQLSGKEAKSLAMISMWNSYLHGASTINKSMLFITSYGE